MNQSIPLLPVLSKILTLIGSVQSVTARADTIIYQKNYGSIDNTVYGQLIASVDAIWEEVLACSPGIKT
jgi:hypothetical protein